MLHTDKPSCDNSPVQSSTGNSTGQAPACQFSDVSNTMCHSKSSCIYSVVVSSKDTAVLQCLHERFLCSIFQIQKELCLFHALFQHIQSGDCLCDQS